YLHRTHHVLHSFPTRRSSDLYGASLKAGIQKARFGLIAIIDADETYPPAELPHLLAEMTKEDFDYDMVVGARTGAHVKIPILRRSEEHTSELQSRSDLVCRLL